MTISTQRRTMFLIAAMVFMCGGLGCSHLPKSIKVPHIGWPAASAAPCPTGVCVTTPMFHGYHATCWRRWPDGWVGCPEQQLPVESIPRGPAMPARATGPNADDVFQPRPTLEEGQPSPGDSNQGTPPVLPERTDYPNTGIEEPSPSDLPVLPPESGDARPAPDAMPPDATAPIEPRTHLMPPVTPEQPVDGQPDVPPVADSPEPGLNDVPVDPDRSVMPLPVAEPADPQREPPQPIPATPETSNEVPPQPVPPVGPPTGLIDVPGLEPTPNPKPEPKPAAPGGRPKDVPLIFGGPMVPRNEIPSANEKPEPGEKKEESEKKEGEKKKDDSPSSQDTPESNKKDAEPKKPKDPNQPAPSGANDPSPQPAGSDEPTNEPPSSSDNHVPGGHRTARWNRNATHARPTTRLPSPGTVDRSLVGQVPNADLWWRDTNAAPSRSRPNARPATPNRAALTNNSARPAENTRVTGTQPSGNPLTRTVDQLTRWLHPTGQQDQRASANPTSSADSGQQNGSRVSAGRSPEDFQYEPVRCLRCARQSLAGLFN
jgi:hypothetical protein